MSSRRSRRLGPFIGVIVLTHGVFTCTASPQTEGLKIAVVYIQEVVEGSPEFERASEDWSRVLTEKTAAIQTRQEERREAELLLTNPDTLQGDARLEVIGKIERLQIDIDRMTTETQVDLNSLRRQLIAPVVANVNALVESYGEENGFDLVINMSSPNVGLTLATQNVDITEALLDILRDTEKERAPAPDSSDQKR